MGLDAPVNTRTAKGKPIKRHYYFDIRTALEGEDRLEEPAIAVEETRQPRRNFVVGGSIPRGQLPYRHPKGTEEQIPDREDRCKVAGLAARFCRRGVARIACRRQVRLRRPGQARLGMMPTVKGRADQDIT